MTNIEAATSWWYRLLTNHTGLWSFCWALYHQLVILSENKTYIIFVNLCAFVCFVAAHCGLVGQFAVCSVERVFVALRAIDVKVVRPVQRDFLAQYFHFESPFFASLRVFSVDIPVKREAKDQVLTTLLHNGYRVLDLSTDWLFIVCTSQASSLSSRRYCCV